MEKNGAAMWKIHILSISTNSEIVTLTMEYSFDLSATLFVLEPEVGIPGLYSSYQIYFIF